MVTVQRYNVILEIEEELLDKYIKLGYNQIDPKTGKVIKESVPNDIQLLRIMCSNQKTTIEELESQVKKLEKQISSLKKKAKSEPKTDE